MHEPTRGHTRPELARCSSWARRAAAGLCAWTPAHDTDYARRNKADDTDYKRRNRPTTLPSNMVLRKSVARTRIGAICEFAGWKRT